MKPVQLSPTDRGVEIAKLATYELLDYEPKVLKRWGWVPWDRPWYAWELWDQAIEA